VLRARAGNQKREPEEAKEELVSSIEGLVVTDD
jgi:hypothetical protein